MVADNPALASFNAYLLQTIGSGLTLFQNPALTTFAAPDLTSIASNAPADVITTGLQARGSNPRPKTLNLTGTASDAPADVITTGLQARVVHAFKLCSSGRMACFFMPV